MAADDADDVMDIKELAGYLRLSLSGIYKKLSDGHLPGYKVGKHWLFRRSAINAWMNSQGNQMASAFPSVDPAPPRTGLTARSLQPRQADPRPVRKPPRSAPLTEQQFSLLKGMWVNTPQHFVAIARTAEGRVSLAELLRVAPRAIDEIAEALEASPGAWPDRGP